MAPGTVVYEYDIKDGNAVETVPETETRLGADAYVADVEVEQFYPFYSKRSKKENRSLVTQTAP